MIFVAVQKNRKDHGRVNWHSLCRQKYLLWISKTFCKRLQRRERDIDNISVMKYPCLNIFCIFDMYILYLYSNIHEVVRSWISKYWLIGKTTLPYILLTRCCRQWIPSKDLTGFECKNCFNEHCSDMMKYWST